MCADMWPAKLLETGTRREETILTLIVAVIGGNSSWYNYVQDKIENSEYIYLLLFYYFLRIYIYF